MASIQRVLLCIVSDIVFLWFTLLRRPTRRSASSSRIRHRIRLWWVWRLLCFLMRRWGSRFQPLLTAFWGRYMSFSYCFSFMGSYYWVFLIRAFQNNLLNNIEQYRTTLNNKRTTRTTILFCDDDQNNVVMVVLSLSLLSFCFVSFVLKRSRYNNWWLTLQPPSCRLLHRCPLPVRHQPTSRLRDGRSGRTQRH